MCTIKRILTSPVQMMTFTIGFVHLYFGSLFSIDIYLIFNSKSSKIFCRKNRNQVQEWIWADKKVQENSKLNKSSSQLFSDLVAHGPGRVDEAPVGGTRDAVICPPLIPVPLHLGQAHQQRRQGGQHHCGQRHRVLNLTVTGLSIFVVLDLESVRSLPFSWRSECFPHAMDHQRCGAGGLAPAFSLQTGI